MSTDYLSGTAVSDHDVTIAIPGEAGSVRARLIEALQQVGYKVLGEQPLYAKRGKQGAACYDCSINALDYPTTVTILLRQTNDAAVLATFNYEVQSYMHITKGDRQTLAREAEAIAALATERLAISACRSCGTPVTDESHFCRRCGAPLVFDVPELEVLRLTRNVRGSYHHIIGGLITLLAAWLALVGMLFLKGGAISAPVLFVALPFTAWGLVMLVQGIWKLHRTLNVKTPRTLTNAQPAFRSSVTTALPPAPVNGSVTEATTNLLTPSDRRVKEPVERKNPNTAELDTDRLM